MNLPARLVAAALSTGSAAVAGEQSVVAGPGNDYQVAVIQPWQQPPQRIAVFERLNASFSGDLWLTRSSDAGATWSTPTSIIATASNERHPSLVQTGESAYALFHLSNAGGSFRIHRATSADGNFFMAQGALDLGWPSGGEINPQVLREPDGGLILVYHRLGGAAYLARSSDDGVTWDTLRTQISPGNAALPRLVHRANDDRYLLLYQTGSNPVSIWTKTSSNPYDWSATAVGLVADGNNHDGWPVVMSDGRFAIVWARVASGAFQIHSSHSLDGLAWSAPVAHTHRPSLANVQPHALVNDAPSGHVELYWGAAQLPGDSNYDIVRHAPLLLVDVIFQNDLEANPHLN